jgi:hypothetical protein
VWEWKDRVVTGESTQGASSAFQELSAVHARLESSGSEVKHAALEEHLTGGDETVTAELSIGVPILSHDDASHWVSITTVDATVAELDGAATGTAPTQAVSDCTAVVDLLAERPTGSRSDFGLPDSVTVGGLAEAINRSWTVYGLARRTGVSQATVREFLRAFDLGNLVSHSLATEQVTVSSDSIRRGLGPAGR